MVLSNAPYLRTYHGTATSITNDKVIPHFEVIRLYGFQRVDSGRFRLADQPQIMAITHTGPLSSLQSRILGGIAPHRWHRQHKLHLRRLHEAIPVTSTEGVHR